MRKSRFGCVALALLTLIVLGSAPHAWAATKTLSFDTPEYGVANVNCTTNPPPPLFNRPEYGFQTGAYIVDPAGACEGAYQGSQGSNSLLTAFFSSTAPNSDEIHFSWVDPTDDNSWARIYTFGASGVIPKLQSPTVHLGVGSSIKMDITVFGTDGSGSEVEQTSGKLEFCLLIRETGLNVPLGADGGIVGPVEFVGVTGVGGPTDANTPVGGTQLTHSSTSVFSTIEWKIVSTTQIEVRINGGAPVTKNVVGLPGSGDGVLSAANNRGTLDSLIIRKPVADDTTKKWFVNVDNIVIDAPGVIDPVIIEGPLSALDTEVTVTNIDVTASAVTLYSDTGSGPQVLATATQPPEDFTDNAHTFTALTLPLGAILTATQTVGGSEGPPSAGVEVLSGIPIDDFSGGVVAADNPAGAGDFLTWYDVNNSAFATAATTTLDGSPAMLIDDSGFMNGVYRIYEGVVPAAGTYHVTADIHVTEDDPTAIAQYQVGVIVNGQHRGVAGVSDCHNVSLLAVDTTKPGNAVGNYAGLTSGDDSGLPTQTVATGAFTANAGDNLLIVFGTNVNTAWKDVVLDAGRDLILGTCDDIGDTIDPCDPQGPPPGFCRNPVLNDQGTFNWRTNRSSTSLTWGANASIQVDNIILNIGAPNPCQQTPAVTLQTPLLAGQTTVTVNDVDAAATEVKVYANDSVIGSESAPGGFGTTTVVVGVTALVHDDTIKATQVLAGVEGCLPVGGPQVDSCDQIPTVAVGLPLNAGQTTVTVTGVHAAATSVKVYKNGSTSIGELTTLVGGGTETVPVTALVKGDVISATQTIATLEGCVPQTGLVVGSGGNTGILLSLGLRETGSTGAIGSDGGLTGDIEFLVDSLPSPSTLPPIGQLIQPSPDWQTVTFNPTSDLVFDFTGDGVLNGAKGVLESLGITADPNSLDVGPYTLYIDNITSAGVTFADFEAITAGEQAVFRQPTFSGTTSTNVIGPPNEAVVDDTVGDASSKSVRVAWRFRDEDPTRWIRLTTNGAPNLPNPVVDFTQPITMRVLLLPPAGPACPTPPQDTDDDGDVDLADFGTFLSCFNGPNRPWPGPPVNQEKCTCLDSDADTDVDLSDFSTFLSCFNGPNRPPASGCPGI